MIKFRRSNLNIRILIVCFILIVCSFILGMKWQEFKYNDICLDMGGGKNPDGKPICIVEKIVKN